MVVKQELSFGHHKNAVVVSLRCSTNFKRNKWNGKNGASGEKKGEKGAYCSVPPSIIVQVEALPKTV